MCRRLDSDCQYIKRLVKLGAYSAPVLKPTCVGPFSVAYDIPISIVAEQAQQ